MTGLTGDPAELRACASRLRGFVTEDFQRAQNHLPGTIVHTPAFGGIGGLLGWKYDQARDTFVSTFESGMNKLEEIADKLDMTADTLEAADEASVFEIVE